MLRCVVYEKSYLRVVCLGDEVFGLEVRFGSCFC